MALIFSLVWILDPNFQIGRHPLGTHMGFLDKCSSPCMTWRAPKKRPIVSERHSGEPKGRKVLPQLFQGLKLWPYARHLISPPPIPPSELVRWQSVHSYKGSHPLPGGRPGSHTQYSSETIHAHPLKMSIICRALRQRCWKDIHQRKHTPACFQ